MKTNSFTTQVEKKYLQNKKMKLIHGFMCFAYNEMHHEGWYITELIFVKNIKFLITKIIV
jgi:hypothetical protein